LIDRNKWDNIGKESCFGSSLSQAKNIKYPLTLSPEGKGRERKVWKGGMIMNEKERLSALEVALNNEMRSGNSILKMPIERKTLSAKKCSSRSGR